MFIEKYYVLLAFAAITATISYITFYMTGTGGAMWCWVANSVWLFVI